MKRIHVFKLHCLPCLYQMHEKYVYHKPKFLIYFQNRLTVKSTQNLYFFFLFSFPKVKALNIKRKHWKKLEDHFFFTHTMYSMASRKNKGCHTVNIQLSVVISYKMVSFSCRHIRNNIYRPCKIYCYNILTSLHLDWHVLIWDDIHVFLWYWRTENFYHGV